MSDSKTNKPINEKEKADLLNKLIRERFGEWATRKEQKQESEESPR
jgi:hypothetical protein